MRTEDTTNQGAVMREPITIRGRWTVESYAKLLSHSEVKQATPSIKKMVIYGLVAIAGLALVILCLIGPARYGAGSIPAFIICVLCARKLIDGFNAYFFTAYRLRQKAKAFIQQHSWGNKETEIILDSECVVDTTGAESRKSRWAAFNSYQKHDDVIWIIGVSNIVTIPRAWVADDDAWQSIITFIDEKISAPAASSPTP